MSKASNLAILISSIFEVQEF